MSDLHSLTLTELAEGLSARRFSSRDIVDALLTRIDKADGKLHAFTEVYGKEAKALADAADTARRSGFPLGPLHGLPMAYKDLCDIAGRIGTGGSKMYATRQATETSNTVERLTAARQRPPLGQGIGPDHRSGVPVEPAVFWTVVPGHSAAISWSGNLDSVARYLPIRRTSIAIS